VQLELLDPEDEDTKLLQNVGNYIPVYTASCHRRLIFIIITVRTPSLSQNVGFFTARSLFRFNNGKQKLTSMQRERNIT